MYFLIFWYYLVLVFDEILNVSSDLLLYGMVLELLYLAILECYLLQVFKLFFHLLFQL
jgi:hypothetical protein